MVKIFRSYRRSRPASPMIIINNKNSGDDDAAPLLPHPIGIDRDSGVPVISFSFEVRLALPSHICSSRSKAIRKLATAAAVL